MAALECEPAVERTFQWSRTKVNTESEKSLKSGKVCFVCQAATCSTSLEI